MYNQPKTPSRGRARSEARTPLTPSIFSSINNLSLASSPTKRSSRLQASTGTGGGVIRKGGVESRLEVVTRDYVPPPPPKYEIKRSKSTPASVWNPGFVELFSLSKLIYFSLSRTESDPTNATVLLPIAIPPISQSYLPLSIKFH